MFRTFILLLVLLLSEAELSAQQPDEYSKNSGSAGLWLGATAGPSLLLEKAPDSLQAEFKDYLNNLRSGSHYGFQAEYFLNPYLGFGAKYVRFTTRLDADSIITEFFSRIYYISISNNMHIHTISPMVYGRLPLLKNKLSVVGGMGMAVLLYRNIYESIDDSASFKGSSPGLSTSFRATYEVIPNLHLGFQTGYVRAFLKGYTKDNGTTVEKESFDEQDYQNLSRFDFSIGVYYTFRHKLNRH